MKAVLVAVVLAFAAVGCVYEPPGPYDDIARPQRTPDGDISVRVPNQRRTRDEARAAAQRCAVYGRVEDRRRGRDYDCVPPSEAARVSF